MARFLSYLLFGVFVANAVYSAAEKPCPTTLSGLSGLVEFSDLKAGDEIVVGGIGYGKFISFDAVNFRFKMEILEPVGTAAPARQTWTLDKTKIPPVARAYSAAARQIASDVLEEKFEVKSMVFAFAVTHLLSIPDPAFKKWLIEKGYLNPQSRSLSAQMGIVAAALGSKVLFKSPANADPSVMSLGMNLKDRPYSPREELFVKILKEYFFDSDRDLLREALLRRFATEAEHRQGGSRFGAIGRMAWARAQNIIAQMHGGPLMAANDFHALPFYLDEALRRKIWSEGLRILVPDLAIASTFMEKINLGTYYPSTHPSHAEDAATQAIKQLKEAPSLEAVRAFLAPHKDKIQREFAGRKIDVVTSIPNSGAEQGLASFLPTAIGEILGVESAVLFERDPDRDRQKSQAHLFMRLANAAGSLSTTRGLIVAWKKTSKATKALLEGKTILIVDDIGTSGVTLEEAKRIFYSEGVGKVYLLNLAQTN